MLEFFRGWKRKAGCVTLMVACVFMALWLRSLCLEDNIQIPSTASSRKLFVSKDGTLAWRAGRGYASRIRPLRWYSYQLRPETFEGLKCLRNDEWCVFNFSEYVDDESVGGANKEYQLRIYSVAYWSIVLPLTAVSAWLLLSKPRVKKVDSPIIPTGENA